MKDKKTQAWALVGVIALLALIGTQAADLSDFLSGFSLGLCATAEVVAVYMLAKCMKANKEEK